MSASISVSAREISSSRPSFEGKLILQSNLEKMMVNVSYDLVLRVVEELSELYNFDSTEAIELLHLDGITLEKRSEKRSEKKLEKRSEKRVEKPKKAAFQFPFSLKVKEENCCGLKFAQGLFVQCHMIKAESSSYCQGCSTEASKNANGKPDNGTVEDRLSCDLMAYKSPLGKQVVPYAKWMLKHNLTRAQVTEEATRLGLEIDERHFEMPLSSEAKKGRPKSEKVVEESSEKKKGRPKKSKKVLEIETNDIFAELVAAASSSEEESDLECESVSVSVSVSSSVVSKASEKSELSKMKNADKESKEAEKKAAKEAEKAAKEAEKESKKEAEKAAKEAKEAEKKKKEEEKAAKEAEKESKKEAEKAAKEAKEAEKKKKEEEKAAKEAEKKKKEEEKASKATKKNEKASNKEEVEVVEQPIKVVIINAKGQTKKTGLQEGDKKFLRSSKGEILDFKTQETIGTWNAEESRIEFNEDYVESDDEDEEEEEEYDE